MDVETPTVENADAAVRECLARGAILMSHGKAVEAVPLFRRAAEMAPGEAAPLVRLAEALIDADALPAALRVARRAVRADPAASAPRRVLGHALLLAGEHDKGTKALTDAADRAGDDCEAWFDLWRSCLAADRPHAATVALREVLSLDRYHDAANAEIARRENLSGDDASARARLADVLRHQPGAARCRFELASLLLQDGQAEQALVLLDSGTPVPEQQAAWAVRRVHALIRVGRRTEARAALDAIGGPPEGVRLPFHHAQLRLARNEEAAAEMTAALEAPGEDPEERIAAHFSLARFWIRRHEPARAFDMMRGGHALLARREPFDRAAYQRFVDATISRFDKARLCDGPRASNTSELPVFVVGMPRSGTTLMEQILAAHAAVFGAGERRALTRSFHTLGGDTDDAACVERIAALDATALDAAANAYLAELQALAPDKTRIVDKMPGNFRMLGLVGLLLPKARIIHCVRDSRDIGLSIFSMRFRGYHPYAHDLGDLGWYIARHNQLMAHWGEALPNPILRVHLHEWVRHFEPTLRRVLDFLGLPYDANCERFYALDREVRTASRQQVKEAINAKGMSRWRAFASQLTPLLHELG